MMGWRMFSFNLKFLEAFYSKVLILIYYNVNLILASVSWHYSQRTLFIKAKSRSICNIIIVEIIMLSVHAVVMPSQLRLSLVADWLLLIGTWVKPNWMIVIQESWQLRWTTLRNDLIDELISTHLCC